MYTVCILYWKNHSLFPSDQSFPLKLGQLKCFMYDCKNEKNKSHFSELKQK